MKNQDGQIQWTFVIAIGLVLVLVAFVVYRLVPPPPPPSCPEPVEVADSVKNQLSLDFRAELENAISVEGDKLVEFTRALDTYYAPLSDDNVAFLLAARAIKCFLREESAAGDEIARSLAAQMEEILKSRFRESINVASGPETPLTEREINFLRESKFGEEALEIIQNLGI